MVTSTVRLDEIRGFFAQSVVGRRIEYFGTTSSTNDRAWEHAHDVDGHGLVVLADHQGAGRGRFGREWLSPRGASVLCSVLWIDRGAALLPAAVSLLPAVAAADAILAATGLAAMIRWPNDLMIGDRKVGGILVESRCSAGAERTYVIGIGINCLQQHGHFPAELDPIATSLDLETDGPVDRTRVVEHLLRRLNYWLFGPAARDAQALRQEWLARAEPMGRTVRLRNRGEEFRGVVEDIDPQGSIVLRLDQGGVRAFPAHDTTIIRDRCSMAGAAPL